MKNNLITLYTQAFDDPINIIGTFTEDKVDEAIEKYKEYYINKINSCKNFKVSILESKKENFNWMFKCKYEAYSCNGQDFPESFEWYSIEGILIENDKINNTKFEGVAI